MARKLDRSFKLRRRAPATRPATVSFTVNLLPAPACQTVSRTIGASTGAQVAFDCSATDGVANTHAIVGSPSHGTLSNLDAASGTVTYTPNAGYVGTDSFTYKASNAGGDSNTATVNITVIPPPAPVCQPVSRATAANTGVQVSFVCSATNGFANTHAIVGNPAHGTASNLAAANGTVTYTPNSGYAGSDSFTYNATNAGGGSNSATVTITITDASAPSISITSPASGSTYTQGQVINANYSCTDPDGSANIADCLGPAASGSPIDTSSTGAHVFTVVATDLAGNSATQTVRYTVSQAGGGPGGSTPTIDTSGSPSVKARGSAVVVAPGIIVSCPSGGEACTAGARATAQVPAPHARTKTKKRTIGQAHVTIPAGRSKPISFKLNRTGARLLRKRRHLRVTVTVVAGVGHNTPITATKTITIKAPRRRHHH